jgi:hypothetical protein
MENSMTPMPLPNITSVILLVVCAGTHFFTPLTHQGINNWIVTISGLCAIVSYGNRFLKHLKSKGK